VAIRIHPSLLTADFVNLENELQKIASADAVHVDVMDNRFVDALTFGPQMVRRIQEVSPIPLDVHLMVENPDRHAMTYADLGAQSVTFHVEAASKPQRIIDALHAAGTQAAIALKPNTELEPYLELFHTVDMILVMTVEPGAGGQPFLASMLPKIERLAEYLSENQLSPRVEVDGGITIDTLPLAYQAGANTFVAGSSVYGHGAPSGNIQALRASMSTKGA
jgi:ribulose-phosphate 3-epimerase